MKIILLIVLAILLIVILIYSRCPYIGCLTLITGALKSGKTLMGLRCALRKYKSAVLRWKLSCLWMRIIHKPEPEEPLFYTNISVAGVRFVPVTLDILYRRVRVARKSVMFLSETSLIADSMTVKDALLNEEINVFFKLYGHESHGGKCIIETQNVLDNHYAIKRCLTFYYNIDANFSLPFFKLVRFYKIFYSDDDSVKNVVSLNSSVEYSYMLIPKTMFTRYDSYTYSWLTDDLPLLDNWRYIQRHRLHFFYGDRNLKSKEMPTFKNNLLEVIKHAKNKK
nr:MAG TPA: zonular occludens toxin [Inoviridae sp.]